MLKSVYKFDYFVFRMINQQWHHPIADMLVPFLRNPFFWTPLYLFLITYIILNFRKQALRIISLVLISFAATDLISARIFKTLIERPRPCWDWSAPEAARMLIPCSHSFSFVSSHAANHFGISTFLFFTFWKLTGKRYWAFFLWAFLVCYAQVYVGAHYPTDVIGGGILGSAIGFLLHRQFGVKNRLNLKIDSI